jgi:hypothetical protein
MSAALVVLLAYLYGLLTGLVPSPDEVGTFWVANIGAPYLLIPLAAGASRDRLHASVLLGSAATAAAIAGFYRFHAVGFGRTPGELNLPPQTGSHELVIESYRLWFGAMLGSNNPWLLIALLVGAAAGLAGWRWRTRGARLLAAAVATVLLVEPLVHLSGVVPYLPSYERSVGNLVIWSAEAAVGVAVVGWILRGGQTWRRSPMGMVTDGNGHECARTVNG